MSVRSLARLIAAVAVIAAPACDRTGPRVPTTLEPISGDGQSATVATAVATPPSVRVRDQRGEPLAGVSVTFAVTRGGGSVPVPSTVTNELGIAGSAGWTLGTEAGQHVLVASVVGLQGVSFQATATPGPPAELNVLAGSNQQARVGEPVPTAPSVRVRDAFGNPVPGTQVSFQVETGGGHVEPSTQLTDAAGVASAGAWTLGPQVGENRLQISATGGPSATLTAQATPGAPAQVAVNAGDGQSAEVDGEVDTPPSVRVTDAFGNAVPGVTVTFDVTQGGGTVEPAVALTDANGVAATERWRLGPTAGMNALSAAVEALPPATFTATAFAGPVGGYFIDVRFVTDFTPTQRAVFAQAAERWQTLITGDLASVPVNIAANSCGTHPAFNEVVDDLVIFASAVPIDGPGGVLGQAGPCLVRSSNFLPVVGLMSFDVADLAVLESSGDLMAVILHEMGHVLGFGTIWEWKGVLSGKGGPDPFFTGSGALQAFNTVGGASYFGNKVPVENTGGGGTRDSHWRESVFRTELMTGFLNAGVDNPLSVVTAASLADLGYQVDLPKADGYLLPVGPAPAPGPDARTIELIELPLPPPILVGPDGTLLGPLRPQPE